MQHDNSDDPWGFWNDEPTRQLKRTPVGTRAHGETRMVPVVRVDRTRPMDHPHRPRNPLLTRVGAMVGAMLLLVPIALSLRDDSSQSVRSADFKPLDPMPLGQLPLPAATDSTLAATTVAPTTILMTTAVPATPAPTTAAVISAAPTDPPTTAAKPKKAAPKTSTTVRATAPPAAATQSAAKVACGLTYTIAAGDAWSTIATRAKVSM